MLLGSARYVNTIPTADIELYLNDERIEFADTTRNLGLSLSSSLKRMLKYHELPTFTVH